MLSLDTLAAALAQSMGIAPPHEAAPAAGILTDYVRDSFAGEPADRVFMYNPDAIAAWLMEKYPHFFTEVEESAPLSVPFCTVMPSVTPVCFGTMYTGAQPEIHGIRSYT